jgi:dipeptidyl aminopeptidase/acylaminoacyl peptidase
MRRFALFAVLVCFSLPAVANSAQPAAPSEAKALAPEALLTLRHLSGLEFSPDGTRVAFVVAEPAKGDQRSSHVWLFDTANGSFRQLTYSAKSETSPKWSPDGKSLAFLSNRDTNQQIYLLPTSGGESVPLTKGKRNISRFEWSLDGKTIAFLAPDGKTEAEEKKEKDKDDARSVDKDDKHARLWLLSLSDKSERAITPANYQLSDLAWFPDNSRLAVIATDHPESDRNTERIFVASIAAHKPEEALVQVLAPRGPFGDIKVSPSGENISFIGSREDGPGPHDLWILPIGMPAAKNLTAVNLDRAVFGYRWNKDRSLTLLAADGFTRKLIRYASSGTRENIAIPDCMPSSFTANDDGAIAFVGENFTEPQEIWLAPAGQQPKKFPEFNRSFETAALIKPELYKYKSFDGIEIEAALLKPSNYDGKSKLPLIALIHGGPTGAWESSIEAWGQLLAARGYAVFYPNIRGSVGYGEKFVESNRADWGGGDFKDVMAGIDDLVNRGVADPDRLGIGGWSYGGYMSEWAITQKTKYLFKAAVSGAGMANLISEYGTEQHPAYDEWFWSVPYEKPTGFLNSSPFLHVKNAKTPTLILQGDADTVDPLGQSQELYRGLKRYGVQTELVVYPREPHGFHEEKHLLDRLNRIVAWYDTYMK